MNSLLANTTNHRRVIMFVSTLFLGLFMVLVFYKNPLTFREFIFPPVVGLFVFEFLFRTRKYLKPVTLPLYIVTVTIVGELLYGLLYTLSYGVGGAVWSPISTLQFLFTEFPYNLYALIEYSLVTGLAYYLIKIYRYESWVITSRQTVGDASNEPVYEDEQSPLSFRAWLRKYNQQIISFFGWYLVNGLIWLILGGPDYYGFNILLVFPINLLALIIFAVKKSTRKIAMGILLAVAFNMVISLILGMALNGWCFIPFYVD